MNESDLLHPPIREARFTPRRFLLVLSFLAAGFVLALLALFLAFLLTDPYPCPQCKDRPFDSEEWKQAGADSVVRQQMVNDLLASRRLSGLSTAAVDDLLGPASAEANSRLGCDYLTYLGPERSIFALDTDFLCIWFRDGIVSGNRIIRG